MVTLSADVPVAEIAPKLQVGPAVTTGVIAQDSATLAKLKPPIAVIVTVDVAELPRAIDDGDRAVAAIEKPSRLKVAVTVWLEFKVTAQVPVPEQPPPLQPVKVEPAVAAAVSVTLVPGERVSTQAPGQLMPAGLLVTVPLPVPVTVTERSGKGVNVAVTDRLDVMVTTQVPVPEQPAPLHPVKVKLAPGVAVSVTWVFSG